MTFRKKNIERDSRFSRTAQSGDDHHLVARNIERDVLKIVLARAMDADGVLEARVPVRTVVRRLFCSTRQLLAIIASEVEGSQVVSFPLVAPSIPRLRCPALVMTNFKIPPGMGRLFFRDGLRRSGRDELARLQSPASGPRSMTQSAHLMTSRLCSITTRRVAAINEPLKELHQHRDIVEMQSSRRLVEDEEVPARGSVPALTGFSPARCRTSLSRCDSPPERCSAAGRAADNRGRLPRAHQVGRRFFRIRQSGRKTGSLR